MNNTEPTGIVRLRPDVHLTAIDEGFFLSIFNRMYQISTYKEVSGTLCVSCAEFDRLHAMFTYHLSEQEKEYPK